MYYVGETHTARIRQANKKDELRLMRCMLRLMRCNKYDRITTSEIDRNDMHAVLCIERRFYIIHYSVQRNRDSGRLMIKIRTKQSFL